MASSRRTRNQLFGLIMITAANAVKVNVTLFRPANATYSANLRIYIDYISVTVTYSAV